MQLILIGSWETGLQGLKQAFLPSASCVAHGEVLLAAGDPPAPDPLCEAHGTPIIVVDATEPSLSRQVAGLLLDASSDRRALLVRSFADHPSWSKWLEGRRGSAAAVDPDFPAMDPKGFAIWFSNLFGAPAPKAHAYCVGLISGSHAAVPRPCVQDRSSRPPSSGVVSRLRASLRDRLWSWLLEADAVDELRRSKVFDAEWYLIANPDVAASGVDPALHFLAAGMREGRAPGPGSHNPGWREEPKRPLKNGWNRLLGRRRRRIT